jgi:hypothetical protein
VAEANQRISRGHYKEQDFFMPKVPLCICNKPCKKISHSSGAAFFNNGYNITCGDEKCIADSRKRKKRFPTKIGKKQTVKKFKGGLSLQDQRRIRTTCYRCGQPKEKDRQICESCLPRHKVGRYLQNNQFISNMISLDKQKKLYREQQRREANEHLKKMIEEENQASHV